MLGPRYDSIFIRQGLVFLEGECSMLTEFIGANGKGTADFGDNEISTGRLTDRVPFVPMEGVTDDGT